MYQNFPYFIPILSRFGFVTYTEKESVDECIKAAPHKIDNKTVETKRAVPRDACTPDVLAKTKKVCTQKCLGYKLIKPNITLLS